jgi:hypothetical protein
MLGLRAIVAAFRMRIDTSMHRGQVTVMDRPTGDVPPEVVRIFEAKRERRRRQADLRLREKARLLLEMQRQGYPLLKVRGVLRPRGAYLGHRALASETGCLA